MKQQGFLANVAGKMLALAAVMMMGMAFTACSNDEPEVEKPKENFFKIDGNNLTAVRVASATWENSFIFFVGFNLSEHGYSDHFFRIEGILPEKSTSATIDLTKQSADYEVGSWDAMYIYQGESAFRIRMSEDYVNKFLSGTMTVNIIDSKTREIEISITNARVIDNKNGDGKEYTVNLYFKGTTEQYSS